MKNIHKTILIWLLTAIIGSVMLGGILFLSKIIGTGHFGNMRTTVRTSFSGGIICLAISVPSMIIFHFLAVRLYRGWQNRAGIKLVLGLYAVVAIIIMTAVVIFILGDARDLKILPAAVPYAVAGFLAALLVSYRPADTKSVDKNSVICSTNEFYKIEK